ncbi:MAG: hypothetical protein AABY95_01845 [Pseudomonadota bacterium]
MKSSGIVLAVVMALVAVGVYFGLQTFAPRSEPATSTEAAVTAEPAAPAPVEAPAEVAPTPAPEPAAPAPTEPVAAAEPVVEEKPEPVATAPVKRTPRKAPPAPDSIAPWWPDPAQMPRSQLKLVHAGQTQDVRAIALLFSEKLDPDSLPKNVEIRDAGGAPVTGEWALGKNERLAYFKVASAGRYTVVLQPTLADVTQHMLGTPLQGPVYIQ